MGAVGVRPANERDDQQALPSKAEGHGGKRRSEGTIRVNIREPGFWESRLPQFQHRDQHRAAEQTSDKCYIVCHSGSRQLFTRPKPYKLSKCHRYAQSGLQGDQLARKSIHWRLHLLLWHHIQLLSANTFKIPNPLTCSLLCSTSLQEQILPLMTKKEMNERRHVSQFMGQNSPRLTLSLYSGKKCFPPLQASIGCKNCRKELLLSNQKTKKRAHIERELFNQCTSNPNAHCPNATLRLI